MNNPSVRKQLLCVSLLFAVSCAATSLAQELEQASFTQAQAGTGATIYQQNCAVCHLLDLQGSFEAPALAGDNFTSNWSNRSVSELLDLIRRTMPPQAPASLADADYAALVAHLLSANDIAPGSRALSFSSDAVAFIGDSANAVQQQAPRHQRQSDRQR